MRLAAAMLSTLALVAAIAVGAGAQTMTVTAQLLAYQDGYVFFTTGDGFHVAPNARIVDAATGRPTVLRPVPRLYARVTFDARGDVVELGLSKRPLPREGDLAAVRRFAVALSTPVPNPDLLHPLAAPNTRPVMGTGQPVVVVFTVEVPPTTPLDASVYLTTDASGWNPEAIPMQRIDALHFRVVERLAAGTVLHYLYTRGSFASEERTQGGLDVKPHLATVTNVDDQVYDSIVYRWADQNLPGQLLQPNVFPTPYNPAPFPNLPPGIHTPQP
jgi:hypothetical protein